jgi:AP-3 complex subunit mu
VVDILEEFIGSPLLSTKIESNYDVVAQLLNEMCDAGAVSTTEGNALRDLVEVEGFLGKLLGGMNIPGKPGFTSNSSGNSSTAMPGISSLGASASSTPALPWRRANVRHTSNELYVDLVETLSVIMAPSGRPISAFANGTIAFTAKISGVPDILLTLSSPSGKHNFHSIMELPVFHPCVRLARWRESPGELSFVPPDGRFVLAGYEVDLLPLSSITSTNASKTASNLKLPVQVEVKTSLGPSGADFEVRVSLSKIAGYGNNSSSGNASRGGSRLGGAASSSFVGGQTGVSSSPVLDDLVVTVPVSRDVRNLSDIRASRGDVTYNPGDANLEWSIPAKETGAGTAVLRCTVVGNSQDDDDAVDGNGFSFEANQEYEYNEKDSENGYQNKNTPSKPQLVAETSSQRDERKVSKNKLLMPNSTRLSFAVRGWLPSGIKVDTLMVDVRKSRGLGEGVKPYKGVKYLCISNGGVEVRC